MQFATSTCHGVSGQMQPIMRWFGIPWLKIELFFLLQSDYKPDGGYIPRILFAEASRRLRPDVKNVKNPKHAYFYRNVEEV